MHRNKRKFFNLLKDISKKSVAKIIMVKSICKVKNKKRVSTATMSLTLYIYSIPSNTIKQENKIKT